MLKAMNKRKRETSYGNAEERWQHESRMADTSQGGIKKEISEKGENEGG